MKPSTSYAILALLATAGSAFGAPLPAPKDLRTSGGGSDEVTGLRSLTVEELTPAVLSIPAGKSKSKYDPTGNAGTRPALVANANANVVVRGFPQDGQGAGPGVGGPAPSVESTVGGGQTEKAAKPISGGLQGPTQPASLAKADPLATIRIGSAGKYLSPIPDAGHPLEGATIDILPAGHNASGKDGVVDLVHDNTGVHVIQTPGTDIPLAVIKADNGKTVGKVEVPDADRELLGQTEAIGPNDQKGNVLAQAVGEVKVPKEDALKVGPVAELDHEDHGDHGHPNGQPRPSSSAARSSASVSASHATASGSASHASASASASHASASASAPHVTASASSSHAAVSASHTSSASHSHATSSPARPHPSASASSSASSSPHPVPSPSNQASNDDNYDDDDSNSRFLPGAFEAERHGGPSRSALASVLPVPSGLAKSAVQATCAYDAMPNHVVSCNGPQGHSHADLIEMCIQASILSAAPSNMEACPDELQHDIKLNTVDSVDVDASKAVQKYVRPCMTAGLL